MTLHKIKVSFLFHHHFYIHVPSCLTKRGESSHVAGVFIHVVDCCAYHLDWYDHQTYS